METDTTDCVCWNRVASSVNDLIEGSGDETRVEIQPRLFDFGAGEIHTQMLCGTALLCREISPSISD